MIELSNNSYLIESLAELPELPSSIDKLYLDLETSSHDETKDSLNPWKRENCSAHLFAITWDQHPKCYAIPRSVGVAFVEAALLRARKWVNHNVKYDAHVCYNDLSMDWSGEYCDTLTLSKLVDSDRTYRGGYGLDALAKEYLNIDLSFYYNSLNAWLLDSNGRIRNRDYGCIPDHVLGEYSCAQVQANRKLHAHLFTLLPPSVQDVWETEKKLTTVLIQMERRGMLIDVQGVQVTYLKSMKKMLKLREQLEKLVGYDFNPKSNPDCHELFINRWGLEASYNENSKGPSFNAATLKNYL